MKNVAIVFVSFFIFYQPFIKGVSVFIGICCKKSDDSLELRRPFIMSLYAETTPNTIFDHFKKRRKEANSITGISLFFEKKEFKKEEYQMSLARLLATELRDCEFNALVNNLSTMTRVCLSNPTETLEGKDTNLCKFRIVYETEDRFKEAKDNDFEVIETEDLNQSIEGSRTPTEEDVQEPVQQSWLRAAVASLLGL